MPAFRCHTGCLGFKGGAWPPLPIAWLVLHARRYPGRKDENWWLVVGDTSCNTLLAIKRVTLQVGVSRGAGHVLVLLLPAVGPGAA